jgi:hypothetical protein
MESIKNELMKEIAEEITTNWMIISPYVITCKHCNSRGDTDKFNEFVHEDYCLVNKSKRMIDILSGK